MKSEFDHIHNRRNTQSLKWEVGENELPLWVADMDFQTAPAVRHALQKIVDRGIFGYSITSEAWESSIQSWWKRRHGWTIDKDWLIFSSGVVAAVTCAVQRLTNLGDNVLLQTPVYDIFYHSVENQGRHVLENPLKYEKGSYDIDFEDLEQKLAHPQTTMMILCNPHNPVGKIWSREELARIGDLCKRHHVTVLSDEIHCDLTDPDHPYTPFAAASEVCLMNSVTCLSASKAFNLAGLQGAAVVTPNAGIRNTINRGLNSDELAEPNVFVTDAMIAAFNEGEEWLESLRQYLYENKAYARAYIHEHISSLHVASGPATYLMWVDVSALTQDAAGLAQFIRQETGLYIAQGTKYRGNGHLFLRINLACPRAILEDAMKRLEAGINAFKAQK